MQEYWNKINKLYFFNITLASSLLLSIFMMFVVQFKVDSLQDDILKTKNEISNLEDEIRILEVEWVYLTRPERLRTLVAKHLKNNGYALASQIKSADQIESIQPANFKQEIDSTVIDSDNKINLDI
jgi:hypothetical protein